MIQMRVIMKYFVVSLFSVCISYNAAQAGFEESIEAYNMGDYKTAATELEALVAEGDPYAQFLLGLLYTKGKGVEQNYERARHLLRLSRDQGFPFSQYLFGIYLIRFHTSGDSRGQYGVYLLKEAAYKGDSSAFFQLGGLFIGGRLLPRDLKQAYAHFKAGLELNLKNSMLGWGTSIDDETAIQVLNRISQEMDDVEISEAKKNASKLIKNVNTNWSNKYSHLMK